MMDKVNPTRLNAFRKAREEFERKIGGKECIEWTGKFRNVHPDILHAMEMNGKIYDGYHEPKCLCGQKTYTIFQIRATTKPSLLHWVGTCCIEYYRGKSCFGGEITVNGEKIKTPIKQNSYANLIRGYALYVKHNPTPGSIERVQTLIRRCKEHKTGMYITQGEKKVMEMQLGMKITFTGREW